MSIDRLLLNVMFTAWIVLGVRLEERDLLVTFGEDYKHYRQDVPMFVPRPWRRRRQSSELNTSSRGHAA